MALFKKHWTPTFILDRVGVYVWEKRHADCPWLVAAAVEALADLVRPTDLLVEFGSGRSTLWFAGRARRVISIEDYQPWYDKVRTQLTERGASNVDYRFAGADPESYLRPATEALGADQPDAVLVDGFKHRDHAALWALDRVRPGGIVVVDNINWYLPHRTRTPASVGASGRPVNELWARFAERTCGWRRAWFSSGVSDTAIYFAPPSQRPAVAPEQRVVVSQGIASVAVR